MINLRFCLLIIYPLLILGPIGCWSVSHEAELRQKLLKNYDPTALPSVQTNVSLRFTVLHFTMNEELQSMDLDLWISMEWIDRRLVWRQSNHPEIERLSFEKDQIWFPDITIYSTATSDVNVIQSSTKLLVNNDGSVMWVPPSHVKAMCVMDMTHWPYDTHNCTLKFGSWVHPTKSIDIQVKDDIVNTEEVAVQKEDSNLSRSEWIIIDSHVFRSTKIYDCCPEEYVSASASLLVHRNGKSYWWTVQMPLIVLSFICVVVFVLPPMGGEKIILAGMTFFLDIYFLITTSQIIGHASTHTPKIVQLIGLQVIISGISMIASAIILRLAKNPTSSRLPKSFRNLAHILAKLLCIKKGPKSALASNSLMNETIMKRDDLEMNESDGRSGTYSPNHKEDYSSDWMLAAIVLDRICLIGFLVLFIIIMVSFSDVL